MSSINNDKSHILSNFISDAPYHYEDHHGTASSPSDRKSSCAFLLKVVGIVFELPGDDFAVILLMILFSTLSTCAAFLILAGVDEHWNMLLLL